MQSVLPTCGCSHSAANPTNLLHVVDWQGYKQPQAMCSPPVQVLRMVRIKPSLLQRPSEELLGRLQALQASLDLLVGSSSSSSSSSSSVAGAPVATQPGATSSGQRSDGSGVGADRAISDSGNGMLASDMVCEVPELLLEPASRLQRSVAEVAAVLKARGLQVRNKLMQIHGCQCMWRCA